MIRFKDEILRKSQLKCSFLEVDVSIARANLWDVSARMLAFVLPRGSRQGVLHAPVRVQIVGMSQAVSWFRRPQLLLIQRNF